MTDPRVIPLAAALAPYLSLVLMDAWMHEKARAVPRIEQLFHLAAALLLIGFVAAVFLRSDWALALLGTYGLCAAVDEIGFHRHLSASERRVHFVSYAALALFVVTWRLAA